MLLCCCKIGYLVGGWYEPLLVRVRTSSGSLTDQYRLIFHSLASPFLPPRREMPACGGREGGVALLQLTCLSLHPAMTGEECKQLLVWGANE